VYSQQVFLNKFFARMYGMLLNIYFNVKATFCLPKPYRSISCIHLSRFPWKSYTRTNCPKTGMISFGTRLLGKEKLSKFCRTHEQIKNLIFSVLVQCTQVNMMLVMLLWDWVYIHTGQAWKICLATLGRHIFQACPVWIYIQNNITSIK
jgi:hypothetical protein